MTEESTPAVETPVEQVAVVERSKPKKKPKRQPPYNVILWDDNDHTYDYVIAMMQKLFGHPAERAAQIAHEVDTQGKAIVWTTAREHAELKRDQIHAFGKDSFIKDCSGSMWATIEPAPQ